MKEFKRACSGFRPVVPNKALHSELLTQLSSWFSSRNDFFAIFEFRVERHFFVIFGNFGIFKFPKYLNIRKDQFPKFPNFFQNCRTFSDLFPNFTELFDQKQGFLPLNLKFYIIFIKFLKFTYIFE
jgi:hypothetical protein